MNIIELNNEYIMNTYKKFPIVIEKGNGMYLYDENGKKYLDFVSGIAVNCLGYQNKNFNNMIINQLNKINHCSNLYYSKNQVEAAKMICEISNLDKVFFCNSGAEANEAALKLARKYASLNNKGVNIISMKNSFHGRTLGALSLTGQEKYQKAFKPLISDIKYAEFNKIETVEKFIDNSICAIIIECIQGEGGVLPINKDFYKKLRTICNENNILLIVDEVQTGIGRTGKYFAFQHFIDSVSDIPDIICMAKGLANGIPTGAIAAKNKAAACFEPSDHASTFGGNFIATAGIISVLTEIKNNDLVKNAQLTGLYLKEKLSKLNPYVKDIRGLGLMVGIDCIFNSSNIISKCLDKGLLLVGAGKNTIRFIPPLIVSKADIDNAIDIFNEVLIELDKKQ